MNIAANPQQEEMTRKAYYILLEHPTSILVIHGLNPAATQHQKNLTKPKGFYCIIGYHIVKHPTNNPEIEGSCPAALLNHQDDDREDILFYFIEPEQKRMEREYIKTFFFI